MSIQTDPAKPWIRLVTVVAVACGLLMLANYVLGEIQANRNAERAKAAAHEMNANLDKAFDKLNSASAPH